MPKVKIVGEDALRAVDNARDCVSEGQTAAWLDGDSPIHLHRHLLAEGQTLRIGPSAVDVMVYVWRGQADAGDVAMAAGSSAIVEHGASLALTSGSGGARILTFAAAEPEGQRAGGHVRLLPSARVPRNEDLGSPGVGGGMHADATLESCALWLHENRFAGSGTPTPEMQARGIHSHSESEVIFVTEGEVRLGQRLFGAGTAIAIAADTLYSLSPGPDGLAFINFRAGQPGAIRFANGSEMDEPEYWRTRVARPEYLEPA